MRKLLTPFGKIEILIDGKTVPYSAQEGRKLEGLCPHVLGRYRITVQFVPDGKAHTIACVFQPECAYEKTPESGERLECQSFYNDNKFKMSIGIECDAGYIGDMRISDRYDYDAGYLENGMAFLIGKNTETEIYTFGIAWIDTVEREDPSDEDACRDIETWYGADPTLAL